MKTAAEIRKDLEEMRLEAGHQGIVPPGILKLRECLTDLARAVERLEENSNA